MQKELLTTITTFTRINVALPSLYAMLTSSLRSNNDKSRNINNEKDDQLKDDDEANKKSERLRNRVRRAFVFLVKASIAFASSLRENATNDIKIIF
jgi:hypothetical protein